MSQETRLVHAFVNSLDLRSFKRRGRPDEHIDLLASPESLTGWLREQELIGPGVTATHADLVKAHDLRACLRAAVGETDEETARPTGLTWPVLVTVQAGRPPGLIPGGSPVEKALGAVAVAAVIATHDGTWARLKPCPAEDCRWIFYDRTRPGRGRWCDPDLCGNREKTRAYRARRRNTDSEDHASTSG